MARGRVLAVAGSDSGGGAGIQADLKAVTALGGYGMTAITALTAQNTLGVFGVETVPAAFVRLQMRVVLDDLGADCCKTGMLATEEVVNAVADELAGWPALKLVLDPVMVATSGARLLTPEAGEALMKRLLPRATLVTPNIPEAEVMTGLRITGLEDMRAAARLLREGGARAVLVKGGHLEGGEGVRDLLLGPDGAETVIEGPRIATRHTHGTGCTLASAIATGIAQGLEIETSVRRAIVYLRAAIGSAPGYGAGHGPVDHTVAPPTGF